MPFDGVLQVSQLWPETYAMSHLRLAAIVIITQAAEGAMDRGETGVG